MEVAVVVNTVGNLVIAVDQEGRELIEELIEQGTHDEVGILRELMESHWTNGSYEPFDAGQANPFVGLTDAPCIAECMNHEDDGTRTIEGRFWYYPEYMIKSPLQELVRNGQVTFQVAR